MHTKDGLRKSATLAFILYMLCLFWILILKCNLRQGVLESRYFLEPMTIWERTVFSLGRFAKTNLKEASLNILVFIPLGLILPFMIKQKTYFASAMIGAATSLIAELCQLFSAIGGFTYVDIINNSVGTFIGVIIYYIFVFRINQRWLKCGLSLASALSTAMLIYAIFNTAKNIDIYIMPPGMLL